MSYDRFEMATKCCECKIPMLDEQVVWAKKDGTLSTTSPEAFPYCEGCCPEQPDYDEIEPATTGRE